MEPKLNLKKYEPERCQGVLCAKKDLMSRPFVPVGHTCSSCHRFELLGSYDSNQTFDEIYLALGYK